MESHSRVGVIAAPACSQMDIPEHTQNITVGPKQCLLESLPNLEIVFSSRALRPSRTMLLVAAGRRRLPAWLSRGRERYNKTETQPTS